MSDGAIDGCDVFDSRDGGQLDRASSSGSASAGVGRSVGRKAASDHRRRRCARRHRRLGRARRASARTASRLVFGTPAFDEAYLAQLQHGIDAVAATGAKVAFLEVACMRPVAAKGAATPPLPERADDARVAHLSALMRAAVERNPQTTAFVGGPAQWCNGSAVATDVGYRWDGVHVYKPGAALDLPGSGRGAADVGRQLIA